jgi:hypothetical protein
MVSGLYMPPNAVLGRQHFYEWRYWRARWRCLTIPLRQSQLPDQPSHIIIEPQPLPWSHASVEAGYAVAYAVCLRVLVRYKVWRSRKDNSLHLLCAEGSEAFETLPVAIRNLGRWTGGPEGEVDPLRLPHRVMFNEQGFAIIYAHVSKLELETTGMRAPAANTECPMCKGSGHVPMHSGLRQKDCPRCGGRGWIRATPGR